ncbi:MAG TPA: hypothetical protein VNR64_11865 [Vicinamibacterales bacterium]|nr:hypothetical protein [Vicinamibacterales bacterium]
MRHATPAVVAFVVALTMRPATAAAQDWSQPWADPLDRPARVDISVSGGVLMPTRWSDLVLLGSGTPARGVLEQVLTRDIHVDPDTEFTAAATYWRSRYGLRVRGGFSRSSVSIGATPPAGVSFSTPPATAVGAASSIGIDTWLYDLGLSIGFLEYEPRRVVWPYGFFGVGGITYDLKQVIAPPLAFLEHPPSAPPANTIIVTDDGHQFLLTTNTLSTETVFAFNLGLGTDFRIPLKSGGVALRLEVADHVAGSPLAFRVEELSSFGMVPIDTGSRYRLVHHLSATAGFVVQIGR